MNKNTLIRQARSLAWPRISKRTLTVIALFCSFSAIRLNAQMTTTGTIAGTVIDPSGKSIPAVDVTLVSETTRETRTSNSGATGSFVFSAVQPGSYTVKAAHPGFKGFERTGITVSANDHVVLGDLPLQIGSVTETVMVTDQAAHVATQSSESSEQITTDQLGNLTARGREVVSLLRTIPGVSYQADQDSPGGTYGTSTSSIRGASSNMNILSVDGVVSNDQGSPNVFSSVTTMDAMGEVKILLNAYQAEYAGNGGTIVQVVSKSGGQRISRQRLLVYTQ